MTYESPAAAPRKPGGPKFSPGKMRDALQPFVDNGTMAGTVTLVATKESILELDAVGYADLAAKKPLAPTDLFWIASMTKPMTATALMMLVDEGRVKVDDPVEAYLPEFKGQMVIAEQDDSHVLLKKPGHPILVREILSHISGLVFASPMERPTFDRLTLRDAVWSYTMTPLQYEPGTTYLYSNAGTNTVGRIIEVVSGMPYADFMKRRLFEPLDLHDTTFWPSKEQLQRLALSYKTNKETNVLEETPIDQLSYPLFNPNRKPLPAGGLFSTATDMAKFCQMIFNGGMARGRSFLSKKAVAEMTRKQTGDVLAMGYGFGWDTWPDNFGHGGAYKTSMRIHPQSGLILVFLIQQAGDWPTEEGDKIYPTFQATAEKLGMTTK